MACANNILACDNKTPKIDLIKDGTASNYMVLSQVSNYYVHNAAIALGVLLGLLFNVAALLFALVAFAGLSVVVAITVQLHLATPLMFTLSAGLALCKGYLGGAALREWIRPRD